MAVKIPTTAGLSDKQIDAAERALGCRLPPSLRVFARDHNGAVPEENTFDVSGTQSGVRKFLSLADAAVLRSRVEGFPRFGVPIAEDDCGNYVWLHPETGEIRFWDHEVESDGVIVASDFGVFLAALRQFDAASMSPEPAQVRRVWVNPSFKPEFD